MTRQINRADLGNLVFSVLSHSDPTTTEGCEESGLTASQWHSGLAYVRDVLAEAHSEPVVYDARTRRYSLAIIEPEVETYVGKRIAVFLTQLRRLYDGSFVPAGLKFQTQRTVEYRQIDIMIDSLIKSLELATEQYHVPESATAKRRRTDRENAKLTV